MYGTQQPIAFLKLLLERGGCYDRGKDLNWKQMRDLNWVAAMGKPGGGRNEVDPRFLSLFSIFTLTFPEMESLFHIYNSMLSGHFSGFKEDVRDAALTITNMTLEMYKYVFLCICGCGWLEINISLGIYFGMWSLKRLSLFRLSLFKNPSSTFIKAKIFSSTCLF